MKETERRKRKKKSYLQLFSFIIFLVVVAGRDRTFIPLPFLHHFLIPKRNKVHIHASRTSTINTFDSIADDPLEYVPLNLSFGSS